MNKIDFVIAWVDGNDEAWRRQKREYKMKDEGSILTKWNDGEARYRDWDLLRFWFRGVERFAPWVNKIYFVTWGHLPSWLDTSHPKLQIIRHEDYIPEEYLPTFSSHTIEMNFHRIKGLEEQFVYFNDDMFLTAPTRETDFFVGGLPCDTAAQCPVQMIQNGIRAEINDLYVINANFDKNAAIGANIGKWFSPRYGSLLFKTLLLMPFRLFSGFYISHLPCSYLKHTFEEVWAAAPAVLHETCSHRFRKTTDVNQWLCEFWQLAKGEFHPRSPRVGRMVEGLPGLREICDDICRQRYKMVCCNDAADIENYDDIKKELHQAFMSILPEPSAFEKKDVG